MAISKLVLNGVIQMDVTGVTVEASNLLAPNTAVGADGQPVTGTATEKVLTTKSITANGTYDAEDDNADGYSSVTVNVPSSGGGIGVLLNTTSLGALSTSSTTATDTGKTISVSGVAAYDMLMTVISVDTPVNGRHTGTVSFPLLTGTSDVSNKNSVAIMGNRWNSKLDSSGVASTRQSSSAYGVYINNISAVTNGNVTLNVYYRYNSNHTGTINGTYTARVYGIKLIDLIGG